MAKVCHLSVFTAKNAIQRLLQKNLIRQLEIVNSCVAGGTVYYLPKEVRKVIQTVDFDINPTSKSTKIDVQSGTHLEAHMHTSARDAHSHAHAHERDRSVCLFVNKNKTNKQTSPELERELSAREQPSSLRPETLQQLQSSVDQLDLDGDLKLSGNDLAAALEARGCALDEFLASVEHLAFYLRSAEAKGIRSPKTWMLKKLRKGYFGPPADFVSFEERLEAEKTRAKKERVERLRRAQLASFEADFEAWQLDQSPQQLAGLKRELGPALSLQPNSAISRALLRRHFAASTGREHLLGGDEDPGDSRQGP